MYFAFVGDIMLGRGVNDFMKKNANYNIFGNTTQLFKLMGLVCGNLETTITKSNDEGEKGNNVFYKMNPEFASKLKHFDYVSIANNHILDYDKQGMIDTIQNLDKNKIFYGGAGLSVDDAYKMTTKIVNGIKVGIISISDHFKYWDVKKLGYGIWYVDINDKEQRNNTIKMVKKYKKSVDILIVSAHWGPNYSPKPSKNIKDFAKELFFAGVDIIYGHSAHHTQESKIHNINGRNCVVFYGLGDFINDYYWASDTHKGSIGIVKIVDKKIVSIIVIPTKISFGMNKNRIYQVNIYSN